MNCEVGPQRVVQAASPRVAGVGGPGGEAAERRLPRCRYVPFFLILFIPCGEVCPYGAEGLFVHFKVYEE